VRLPINRCALTIKNKSIMEKLLTYALYAYLILSQVFTLYFWYLWAQDHGFWSSVFIGPIVGEFQGLLWPFFM